MPKLKKYSQISHQNSNSQISPSMQAYLPQPKTKQVTHSHRQQSDSSKSQQCQVSDNQVQGKEQSVCEKQISNKKGKNRSKNIRQNSQQAQHNKQRKTSERKKNTQRKSKHKYDADQILKKLQQQCAQNQDHRQQQDKNCEQTDAQIPQDALVGYSGKKNKSKRNKSTGIKVKNKFFDVEVNLDSQQAGQLKQIPQADKVQIAQLDQQYMRLLSQKNQKNQILMDQRKQKIQLKVNKLRGRLEFKNAHEDARFKDNMKQTLNTVKDCEQVQIQIGAPKIFKGATAKQTDAALFIKNLSQNLAHHQSQSQNQESAGRSLLSRPDKMEINNCNINNNNKGKKIDRKQFYQQFTRQVKQINAVQIPIQAQALFKKSSLEELQSQFQKNEHLFKNNNNNKDQNSRHSISRSISQLSNKSRNSSQHDDSKIRKSTQGRKVSTEGSQDRDRQRERDREKESSVSNLRMKASEISKPITVVQEDISNQQSRANCFPPTKPTNNISQQPQQKNEVDNKQKQISKTDNQQAKTDIQMKKKQSKSQQKKKKQNKKQKKDKQKGKEKAPRLTKKQREQKKKLAEDEKYRKKISQLFQLQAQYSDHGSGDNGDSSQQNDNDSLESLIDRQQVAYVKKNERKAHNKFLEQQLKRDELIIQKIKQKITAPRKIKCQVQQNSDSRRRRQSRMNQAKKRFEQQDQCDGNFVDDYQNQRKQNQYNEQETRNEFENQLKLLEDQIGGKELEKQNSKESVGFQKNKKSKPKIWKQIKTLSRVQKTDKNEKSDDNIKARGGFLNKVSSKAITGIKIRGPQKTAAKSKSKHINF